MKVTIESMPALGHLKCPRCWKYHGIADNHLGLCDACCQAIVEGWPDHEIARQASYAEQRGRFGIGAGPALQL